MKQLWGSDLNIRLSTWHFGLNPLIYAKDMTLTVSWIWPLCLSHTSETTVLESHWYREYFCSHWSTFHQSDLRNQYAPLSCLIEHWEALWPWVEYRLRQLMFACIIISVNIQDTWAAFENIPLPDSLGTALFSLLAKVSLYVSTFLFVDLELIQFKMMLSKSSSDSWVQGKEHHTKEAHDRDSFPGPLLWNHGGWSASKAYSVHLASVLAGS